VGRRDDHGHGHRHARHLAGSLSSFFRVDDNSPDSDAAGGADSNGTDAAVVALTAEVRALRGQLDLLAERLGPDPPAQISGRGGPCPLGS
jgi:hypothetical protein